MATSTIKQETSNFFGNTSNHVYSSLTSLDGDTGIINTYLKNGTSNTASVWSVHNSAQLSELSSAGNQQDIFGWVNPSGLFGWAMIISFGGVWFAKRIGTATSTIVQVV